MLVPALLFTVICRCHATLISSACPPHVDIIGGPPKEIAGRAPPTSGYPFKCRVFNGKKNHKHQQQPQWGNSQ